MRIKRHTWTGGTGEVVVEAADDDTIVLQVTSFAPRHRDEGAHLHIDRAIGSVFITGQVEITSAVAMTDAEARKVIRQLEKAIAT